MAGTVPTYGIGRAGGLTPSYGYGIGAILAVLPSKAIKLIGSDPSARLLRSADGSTRILISSDPRTRILRGEEPC